MGRDGAHALHWCRILGEARLTLALALALATMSTPAQPQDLRSWSVADSVAVRYFPTDDLYPVNLPRPPRLQDRLARFSPDGRHFFFVSWAGDAGRDEVEHVLWIYAAADVRRALREGLGQIEPLRQVAVRSGFYGGLNTPAIHMPRWESNRAIVFVCTEGATSRRPCRYDIASGSLVPLAPRGVVMRDTATFATQGDTVIFADNVHIAADDWNRYPFALLTPRALNSAQAVRYDHRADVYLRRGTAEPRLLFQARPTRGLVGPWISPDERWAVTVYWSWGEEFPAAWVEVGADRPRFMLSDLETGASRPIVDAPVGPRTGAFASTSWGGGSTHFDAYWSHDGRRLLLFNTMLAGRPDGWIADVDVARGDVRAIEPFPRSSSDAGLRIVKIEWEAEGRSLLAALGDREGRTRGARRYIYDGRAWSVRAASIPESPRPAGFDIVLREGANEPPWMAAVSGERIVRLTGDDPALAGVRRAQVETLRWTDARGESVEALLMLPPGVPAGTRHPLVVQLGDPFNPADAFRPDGEPGTAFAAQALAAQGFAVLQLEAAGYRSSGLAQTPQEGAAQVTRLDDAVARLLARGVVDEGPIGLIGFSRSAYYAYYIATHPGRTRIGAAVPYDGLTFGFGEYLLTAALRGGRDASHYGWQYGSGGEGRQLGATAFWSDRDAWLDAPVFNLQRLTTPMLFSQTDVPQFGMESLGAFQLARRPFDYFFFPDGSHVLHASGQRAAAMQATVDWMNFWLRDRLPEARVGDPDRARRWQRIRADWARQRAWESAGNPVASIPPANFVQPAARQHE